MNTAIIMQAIGWIGMALIVIAYHLASDKHPDSPRAKSGQQIMNLVGAVALGASAFYNDAWPNVALEVVWAWIAIQALIRGIRA
jgi:hypothetical protein